VSGSNKLLHKRRDLFMGGGYSTPTAPKFGDRRFETHTLTKIPGTTTHVGPNMANT